MKTKYIVIILLLFSISSCNPVYNWFNGIDDSYDLPKKYRYNQFDTGDTLIYKSISTPALYDTFTISKKIVRRETIENDERVYKYEKVELYMYHVSNSEQDLTLEIWMPNEYYRIFTTYIEAYGFDNIGDLLIGDTIYKNVVLIYHCHPYLRLYQKKKDGIIQYARKDGVVFSYYKLIKF